MGKLIGYFRRAVSRVWSDVFSANEGINLVSCGLVTVGKMGVIGLLVAVLGWAEAAAAVSVAPEVAEVCEAQRAEVDPQGTDLADSEGTDEATQAVDAAASSRALRSENSPQLESRNGASQAAVAAPRTFRQWCEAQDSLSEDQRHTVAVLMTELGVEDCLLAERRASVVRLLNLSYQGLTDIEPLASWPQVTDLLLHNNAIQDLSPLAQMPQITRLSLSNNQVTDLTPLASLDRLRMLGLANNPLESLHGLESLAALEELHLSQTQVESLAPLASLANLRVLYLNQNRVVDLTPLGGLTALEVLDLSSNQIENLDPLITLENLRSLNLNRNLIEDTSVLRSLPNLGQIYLHNNPVNRLGCPTNPNILCLI